MIDSHCHLNFLNLRNDLLNIIKRCKDSCVSKLLSINTKPQEFENHLDIIKDFKNIFISYGIHPQEINNESILSFEDLEKQIINPQLIALGETGLDYYHSTEFKEKQIEIFESHIEASKLFDLPIIIHWNKDTGLQQPTTIEHHLSFDNGGKFNTITIMFSKEKLVKLLGEKLLKDY